MSTLKLGKALKEDVYTDRDLDAEKLFHCLKLCQKMPQLPSAVSTLLP